MEYTNRYVSRFYEKLENGILEIQRCNSCGSTQPFPSPCCRKCASTDLRYLESSMRGKMLYVAESSIVEARFMSSGLFPCGLGVIETEEGAILYMPVIEGVDLSNLWEENVRCPQDVIIETRLLGGNYIPVAKIVK